MACENYKAPDNEDGLLTVEPVSSEMVFEVPVSGDPVDLADLKVGSLVTIDADALQVTATTENGVAKIFNLNGAAAVGDTVLVRF